MSSPARQAGKYLIPSTHVVALGRAGAAGNVLDNALDNALDIAPDIAFEDWDDLFAAVIQRLRGIGAQLPAATAGSPVEDPDDRLALLRASVLDCVSALDQLHTSLKLELAGRAD